MAAGCMLFDHLDVCGHPSEQAPTATAPTASATWNAVVVRLAPGHPMQHNERALAHEDNESRLLERITVDPAIFGGKPIIRGRRLAVEHVLGMLAAGDDFETILAGYPWLQAEDVRACLVYARRVVGDERIEPFDFKTSV